MKVAVVLGTRPEIIKTSHVVRILHQRQKDFLVIHTGQHYSYNLDQIFFRELRLPPPHFNLEVGSGPHGKQTGLMLIKIEEILARAQPDVVLVQGDTNSVLAGALAAKKLGIKVGHIEAGLRSYDERMPEEHNRILTDHISDFLFCPTDNQAEILRREGIAEEKIFVTGNTIVEAVQYNAAIAQKTEFPMHSHNFFLATVHRPANTDSIDRLRSIMDAFGQLHETYGVDVVLPVHPRTKKQIKDCGISLPSGLVCIEPVGYLEFLHLMQKSKLILTDSGGVQEEATILRIPCVTLRDNTERPETIEVGANILAGTIPENIVVAVDTMLGKEKQWNNPFGDGRASERIISIIQKNEA